MDRSFRRRIQRVDELLSAAKKEREEKQKKLHENIVLDTRYHATAVAAVVLSGEPKIDEPLSRAWTRALQHYGICEPKIDEPLSRDRARALQYYGIRDVNEVTRMERQVGAAQRLAPIVLPMTLTDAEVSAKFTEIFMPAPAWLLNFTCIFFDACWLKFDFPNRSTWPVLGTKWGRAGYEESLLWPLLPLGTMTDGDPLSDEEARHWPFRLKEAHTIIEDNQSQANTIMEDNRFQNDQTNPSLGPDFLADYELFLDVKENPEKESKLSRYERLRLRDFESMLASSEF